MDSVLALQAEVEKLDSTISTARTQVLAADASSKASETLQALRQSHGALTRRVEELFSSLNVSHSYPDLIGVPRDVMRLLLLARDLKLNIRKRAAANFMEWDRLSQACGGAGAALGDFILTCILDTTR